MFRLVLVVALVAGVARVEAAPKKPTKSKTEAKKADASKKSKPSKKSQRQAQVSRIPSRRTLDNLQHMPHGFAWPPTPAMDAAEKQCEAKLDRANITWEHTSRDGRIVNPILVPSMTFGGVKYSSAWGSTAPQKLDCQLALALETIGPELFALGVREVKFGSVYRWSNVRAFGTTKPILSRHGLGIAMDIGSFVDDSGRSSIVKRDYKDGDQLLIAVENAINANGSFRTVLTPKNDPISHSDHFHIEAVADYTSPDVP